MRFGRVGSRANEWKGEGNYYWVRPRICICCGEPMSEAGNSLSRNPNVCASCSSLADGMEEGAHAEFETIPPRSEPLPPGSLENDPDRAIEPSTTQPENPPVEVAQRRSG